MSAQTSYTILQAKGLPGDLYALDPHEIASRAIEGTAPFGIAVSKGTNKDTQAVKGGADFLGITVRVLDKEGAANTGAIQYEDKEVASILRNGSIWAICPQGCVSGDPVDYDPATGVLANGGLGTVIAGAKWDVSANAGELSIIRLKA